MHCYITITLLFVCVLVVCHGFHVQVTGLQAKSAVFVERSRSLQYRGGAKKSITSKKINKKSKTPSVSDKDKKQTIKKLATVEKNPDEVENENEASDDEVAPDLPPINWTATAISQGIMVIRFILMRYIGKFDVNHPKFVTYTRYGFALYLLLEHVLYALLKFVINVTNDKSIVAREVDLLSNVIDLVKGRFMKPYTAKFHDLDRLQFNYCFMMVTSLVYLIFHFIYPKSLYVWYGFLNFLGEFSDPLVLIHFFRLASEGNLARPFPTNPIFKSLYELLVTSQKNKLMFGGGLGEGGFGGLQNLFGMSALLNPDKQTNLPGFGAGPFDMSALLNPSKMKKQTTLPDSQDDEEYIEIYEEFEALDESEPSPVPASSIKPLKQNEGNETKTSTSQDEKVQVIGHDTEQEQVKPMEKSIKVAEKVSQKKTSVNKNTNKSKQDAKKKKSTKVKKNIQPSVASSNAATTVNGEVTDVEDNESLEDTIDESFRRVFETEN